MTSVQTGYGAINSFHHFTFGGFGAGLLGWDLAMLTPRLLGTYLPSPDTCFFVIVWLDVPFPKPLNGFRVPIWRNGCWRESNPRCRFTIQIFWIFTTTFPFALWLSRRSYACKHGNQLHEYLRPRKNSRLAHSPSRTLDRPQRSTSFLQPAWTSTA